jgi:hypothetical protein
MAHMLTSRRWEAQHGVAMRGLIAADIEELRKRGGGIFADMPVYTGWRRLFHAAITDKIVDPHRTDKMKFHEGTTARIHIF